MLRWRWGCVQGFEDLRVTVTLKDNACDVAEMSVLSATVTLAEKNEKKYTIYFIIDTYLTEDEAEKLVHSQTSAGIVKVKDSHAMPEPSVLDREGIVLNREEAPLDVDIKNGGCDVVPNTKNLPLVGEVGLGADLVRLNGHAMCSPGFFCDSTFQVTYVVRGSDRVQVVGVDDGKRVPETKVERGCLFIVPRFFVVSKIADAEGMEWFSIITTPNPVFTHLAGRTSVWKAMSAEVLQASFDTTPDMEKLFRSKRTSDEIFFPPPSSAS
ncbi:13S globulin basic chain-like [Musa acuminata AAA Group]|uniref:13S globulin basic chain-like n=1 Tax=Musa acuminata AAA Group TaxID=214697 RepID=UPI0031DA90DE